MAVLAALLLCPPLLSQETNRETELKAIRERIAELQGRLHAVRQQARGVRAELAELQLAVELQEARWLEAREARQQSEEALAKVQVEIVELESSLSRLQRRLRQRLLDLSRLGRHGWLRLLLSIPSAENLLTGIRQVRYLAIRDARLLDSYRRLRTEMAGRQSELARQHEEVQQWQRAEANRLQRLEGLRGRQAVLLERLETEDRSLSRQAVQLSDKERKLADLLSFLYGRSEASQGGTPVQKFRGALDWPIRGRLLQGFGSRLEPRYGTRVPHHGIELETVPATEVRAVFAGKVLFAAPLQGYGLTAVVSHPGRVFTLYAGLRELQIEQDAVLSLGDAIGRSGERLYFEIREQNRPVDPLLWLR